MLFRSIRVAGKTGTTSAYRDAWFVGYTGNYVAAVWYGNDDYTPLRRMTGGSVPASTWQKFMTYAHQNIDLRPIPFIEDPLPVAKEPKAGQATAANGDAPQPAVRPKTLSDQAEEMLRALEQRLRKAKPVSANQVVAARNDDETSR